MTTPAPCHCPTPTPSCRRAGVPMVGREWELCSGNCPAARPCTPQASEAARARWDGLTPPSVPAPDPVPPPAADELAEMPSLLQMGVSYLLEWRCWRSAGKPEVDDATRDARKRQCLSCDRYEAASDRCLACGCFLYPTPLGDKLRWATARCPHPAGPRWSALKNCDGMEISPLKTPP